jgi:hypothetical protein
LPSIDPKSRLYARYLIVRFALGTALILVAIWGFFYCHRLVAAALPADDYTIDRSFGWMGAWSSWFVIFFPMFLAGAWLVYSIAHNMDSEEFFRRLRGNGRAASARNGVHEVEVLGPLESPARSPARRIESVSDADAARLQKGVDRTLSVLGVLAGSFLIFCGIFGVIYFSFFVPAYPGRSDYGAWLLHRMTARIIMASVLGIIFGVAVLVRTFAREDTSWLIPLRIFNKQILFRLRIAKKREPLNANSHYSRPRT